MSSASPRVWLMLLASLVVTNVIVRYPQSPHEMGVDSFVMHGLAAWTVETGYAAWILNPLSYVGLYPLAQPAGSIFLVAAFDAVSGVTTEWSILFVDQMIGILGTLGAFIMGMEVRRHPAFGLFTATLFSLSPRFVGALTWQVPTRILFTALIPFLLWAILRSMRTRHGATLLVISSLVVFLMMSAHRLTILMVAVVAAFVIANVVVLMLRIARRTAPRILLNIRLRKVAPAIVLVAFAAVLGSILATSDVLSFYEESEFVSGTGLAVQLANLGVSLARSAGVLLPLVVVGVVAVAKEYNKGPREYMLLATLILLSPTLFLRAYTGFFVVPFTSLFIALGAFHLIRRMRGRLRWRRIVIAGLVVLLLSTNFAIIRYDLEVNTHLPDSTYSQGLYVRYKVGGTVVSNDGLVGARVHAIALKPYLPIGGATTVEQGPEVLLFGYFTPEYVIARVSPVPLTSLTVDSDSPFTLSDVAVRLDWADGLNQWCDPLPRRLSRYDIRYVLQRDDISGHYLAFGNIYTSPFYACIESSRYAMYRDGSTTLWFAYST